MMQKMGQDLQPHCLLLITNHCLSHDLWWSWHLFKHLLMFAALKISSPLILSRLLWHFLNQILLWAQLSLSVAKLFFPPAPITKFCPPSSSSPLSRHNLSSPVFCFNRKHHQKSPLKYFLMPLIAGINDFLLYRFGILSFLFCCSVYKTMMGEKK